MSAISGFSIVIGKITKWLMKFAWAWNEVNPVHEDLGDDFTRWFCDPGGTPNAMEPVGAVAFGCYSILHQALLE